MLAVVAHKDVIGGPGVQSPLPSLVRLPRKWAVERPSSAIHFRTLARCPDTYRRVGPFGATPNLSNASDNVRAPRAASSNRSLCTH